MYINENRKPIYYFQKLLIKKYLDNSQYHTVDNSQYHAALGNGAVCTHTLSYFAILSYVTIVATIFTFNTY